MDTFIQNIHPEELGPEQDMDVLHEDPRIDPCEDCPLNRPTVIDCHENCPFDEGDGADYDDNYEPDPFVSDVEADADALASAGWGTDEDYGFYGYDDEY